MGIFFFFFFTSAYLYSGAIAIGVLQMVLHELPTLRAGAATMPTKWLCTIKGGYSQRVDQTHQSLIPKLHPGPHKEAAHISEPEVKGGGKKGGKCCSIFLQVLLGNMDQQEGGREGLGSRQGSVLHNCYQAESFRGTVRRL